MIAVDLREVRDVVLVVAVVRRRVEALVDSALRIDPARRVPPHLEREHARHVRLEGERLQVEHQLHMLVERIRYPRRRLRQVAALARLVARHHPLDAPLDLPDVLEIPVHALPVGGIEPPLEARDLTGEEVEDAGARALPRRARFRRPAGPEQLVERDPGIPDHRERLRRRGPADRIRVDARVPVRAASRLVDVLDAELHGGDRRVLPEAVRVELVQRGPHEDVRTLGLLRMRLREERRARPEVVPSDLLRLRRLRRLDIRVADDREVVPVRFERTQRGRRQVEAPARGRRRPVVLRRPEPAAARRAVHHLDADEPRRIRDLPRPQPARRHHRVEQRQSDGRPRTSEECPAREVFPCDELHQSSWDPACMSSTTASVPFNRNAGLLTTPRMNADMRWSCAAACRAMDRTVGMS